MELSIGSASPCKKPQARWTLFRCCCGECSLGRVVTAIFVGLVILAFLSVAFSLIVYLRIQSIEENHERLQGKVFFDSQAAPIFRRVIYKERISSWSLNVLTYFYIQDETATKLWLAAFDARRLRVSPGSSRKTGETW